MKGLTEGGRNEKHRGCQFDFTGARYNSSWLQVAHAGYDDAGDGTDGDSDFTRAVVLVTEETQKGTDRSRHEYVNPLLVLTGRDYASISFVELHTRISDALRGAGPWIVAHSLAADGEMQLILSDGRILDTKKAGKQRV